MPRQRYRITDEDVAVVHRWIRGKFRDLDWPKDVLHLTAWDTFPRDRPSAKKLHAWCDRFLDAAQWKQLHAVIRAARRDKHASRTVRLRQPAYHLLHTLAKREHLTLSATIERYVHDAVNALPVHAVPVTTPTSPSSLPRTLPVPLWGEQAETRARMMKVKLYLRVENNSTFVRGKKKAREEIERYVLHYYHMEKPYKDRGEYILSLPYDTDAELNKIIDDILMEASSTADDRHCCIEAEVISVDDPDRSW